MKERTKKRWTKKRITVTAVIAAVIAVFCIVNNQWLVTTEYRYTSGKTDGGGFTVVQISDLHNASFGLGNSRLIKRIEKCSPDIIVITGDIVDANHTSIKTALGFCEKAVDIAPCYYVTGNHEHWLGDDEQAELYEGIAERGVTILDDETRTIEINESRVQICGLDDESLYNDTLPKLAEGFDRSMPVILLAHEPQYFEDYCKAGADLVLTGHAHGGQVRLPFVGGLVAPDQGFLPEYTEGKFEDGDTTMIISRGLGNSVIPVRVFDPPEVVCIRVEGS